MRAVKKLVCYFLIAWLALIAGGANAHITRDAAHGADHAAHAAHAQTTVSDESGSDESADVDVSLSDACNQSHCGHNHGTALPTSPGAHAKVNSHVDAPKSSSCWASAAITDNIERPKWPFTTHVVVSLLT